MATIANLEVVIDGKTHKLQTALKRVDTSMDKTAKGFGGLASSAKKLAIGFGVLVAARAAVNFMKEAAELAETQRLAQDSLALAMKNLGTFTQSAWQENLRFASSLQKVTIFGDETILGVQKMLVTLGGLSGVALKDATKATLNLASALGMDLKAAGLLMSKAAAGQTESLARYGLVLSDTIPKNEKFAALLKLISDRMGGEAQLRANSLMGAVAQLSNAWGDFKENLAASSNEGGILRGIIQSLTFWVERLSGLFAVSVEGLQDQLDAQNALNAGYARQLAGGTDLSDTQLTFIDDIAFTTSGIDNMTGAVKLSQEEQEALNVKWLEGEANAKALAAQIKVLQDVAVAKPVIEPPLVDPAIPIKETGVEDIGKEQFEITMGVFEQLTLFEQNLASMGEAWTATWEGMLNIAGPIADAIGGTYMLMADAFATMVAGGKVNAKIFVASMMKMAAGAILAVGKEAAIKAVFALAEGLLFPALAPKAFAAAKLYGAVAVGALAVGGALMGAAKGMEAGAAGGGAGVGGGGAGGVRRVDRDREGAGNQFNISLEIHSTFADPNELQRLTEEHIGPTLIDALGRGALDNGKVIIKTELNR